MLGVLPSTLTGPVARAHAVLEGGNPHAFRPVCVPPNRVVSAPTPMMCPYILPRIPTFLSYPSCKPPLVVRSRPSYVLVLFQLWTPLLFLTCCLTTIPVDSQRQFSRVVYDCFSPFACLFLMQMQKNTTQEWTHPARMQLKATRENPPKASSLCCIVRSFDPDDRINLAFCFAATI